MEASSAVSKKVVSAAYLAEDRSGVLVGISIACIILTTLLLAARIYAKRFQGGKFYTEDAFTVASYIVNLGMCAVGIIITKVGGVGRHVEFVKEFEPDALVGWAQCLFAFEIIYFTSIALPKLAIILMYLRLFVWKGTLRNISWLLFGLVSATSVSLVISACFQCIPLAFWWDKTTPGGRCFDIQLFFHAQSLPGFIFDLAIMVLPVGTVWSLNLPLIKRLALLGLFVIASFGIVASIIRARIFFSTSAFTDETMASVDLIGWSIIETSMYIATNCLPHLRPLISHYTPKSIKKALKLSLSSFTSNAYSKGRSQSKGSNLKSWGQSRSINPPRDDEIELTRQPTKTVQSQKSPGPSDSWNSRSVSDDNTQGWDHDSRSMKSAPANSLVEINSPGEFTEVDKSGVSITNTITVTREVKLSRE